MRVQESVADFGGFLCLNRANGLDELPVEAAVPVNVGAESGRDARHHDFVDAAERVFRRFRFFDVVDAALRHVGVEHPRFAFVGGFVHGASSPFCQEFVAALDPCIRVLVPDLPDADNVASDVNPECVEQRPGYRAACHAHGGFARAGPVDHGANVVELILLHPRKIGMARTRHRDALDIGPVALYRHLFRPSCLVFLIRTVVDAEGHGTAERFRKPDARIDMNLVVLNLGPTAAPVAEPAPRQMRVDIVGRERHFRRHAFDNSDECFAVRLACGEVTDHLRQIRTW